MQTNFQAQIVLKSMLSPQLDNTLSPCPGHNLNEKLHKSAMPFNHAI